MDDLTTRVRIVGIDDTGNTYQKATSSNDSFVQGVQNGASQVAASQEAQTAAFDTATQQFIRFRTQAEAVDAEWAKALEENAERAKKAAEEPIKGFEKFAHGIGQFLEHPLDASRMAVNSTIEALGPLGVIALAAGAGIYELGKHIVDLVDEEAQAVRQTQNLADRLNLTFEQTKKLGDMAKLVDVNIESLTRVSIRLADALEHPMGAGKKVADALTKMGITANESGEALLKLLEHLSEIPDKAERLAAAGEILPKRMVASLTPLLENYQHLGEVIEGLGGQLSEVGKEELLKAREASNALGISWDHFKESLAATFSGPVTAGLEMLTHIVAGPKEFTLTDNIKNLKAEIADLKIRSQGATVAVAGMMSGEVVSGAALRPMIAIKEAQLKMMETEKFNSDLTESYQKLYTAGQQKKAEAWRAIHNHTIEGLKEEQTENQKLIKSQEGILGGMVKPADDKERVEATAKLTKALEDQKRIKAELKQLEGKGDRPDTERITQDEKQAIDAQKRRARIADEDFKLERITATARIAIERDAAQQELSIRQDSIDKQIAIVAKHPDNAAALQALYGKKKDAVMQFNNQILALDDKAANEKKKNEDSVTKEKITLDKMVETELQASDKRMTATLRDQVNTQATIGAITTRQKIDQLEEIERLENAAMLASLQRERNKLALTAAARATPEARVTHGDAAAIAKVDNQIETEKARHAAAMGKTAGDILKENYKEDEQARAVEKIREDSSRAHNTRMVEVQRSRIDDLMELGVIDLRQKRYLLAAMEELENQENLNSLNKNRGEASGENKVSEVARIDAQIEAENDRHNKAVEKNSETSIKGVIKEYDKFFDTISSGFESTTKKMLMHEQSFSKGIRSMLQQMETDAVGSMERQLIKYAATLLKKQIMTVVNQQIEVAQLAIATAQKGAIEHAASLKSITRAAASAAANAWNSFSWSPLGIVLGAAAAAATFAGVMAFGLLAAEGGADLPGQNALVLTHPREMILPEGLANVVRNAAAFSGSGGTTSNANTNNFNYQGARGESSGDLSRNVQQYQRLMRDGRIR